jgi:hypothetical protein
VRSGVNGVGGAAGITGFCGVTGGVSDGLTSGDSVSVFAKVVDLVTIENMICSSVVNYGGDSGKGKISRGYYFG